MTTNTRQAAVAGVFYPADPVGLADTVARLIAAAQPGKGSPKALIAPHAGFQYSGPVAASAYRLVAESRKRIERVVLLGPAHRVYVQGMALPSVDAFTTPLGDVRLDKAAIDGVLAQPHTLVSDAAHAEEHCLEVHLPFLQCLLDEFEIVPIVVGACAPRDVARVLGVLWGGDETLIVCSSDLSHYHPYAQARSLDADTSAAIEWGTTVLSGEQACGAHAINGLLLCAKEHGLTAHTLDVRNSGDTAGDRARVVGYGAYALLTDC